MAATAADLRAEAARMRRLAMDTTDPKARAAIDELITELEERARALDNGDASND